GTDAESERQNRDEREAGILAQHAGAVAQVLQQFIQPSPTPLVARDLLHQVDIAEFASGGLRGLRCRFAAFDAIACRHLQMTLQLLREFFLLIPMRPRKVHAWPRFAGLRTPAIAPESCSQRERSE